MTDADNDAMAPVARLIAAIGTPDFAVRFLAALDALNGSTLCSAFLFARDAPPRILFAEGELAGLPAFAQAASRDYAREHWRADMLARRLRPIAAARIEVVRVTAGGIADPAHRRDCYERAGVTERLSLCRRGARAILANGYRTQGGYTPEDVARTERIAPVLLAAVARHAEIAATDRETDTPSETLRLLLAAGPELTGREAQVAAGLAQGRSQAEIGAESGLAISSVVTYRRRAYRKLGIGDRRQLRQLLEHVRRTGQ